MLVLVLAAEADDTRQAITLLIVCLVGIAVLLAALTVWYWQFTSPTRRARLLLTELGHFEQSDGAMVGGHGEQPALVGAGAEVGAGFGAVAGVGVEAGVRAGAGVGAGAGAGSVGGSAVGGAESGSEALAGGDDGLADGAPYRPGPVPSQRVPGPTTIGAAAAARTTKPIGGRFPSDSSTSSLPGTDGSDPLSGPVPTSPPTSPPTPPADGPPTRPAAEPRPDPDHARPAARSAVPGQPRSARITVDRGPVVDELARARRKRAADADGLSDDAWAAIRQATLSRAKK